MSALLFLSSFICWKLEHITKAPWVATIHQRHSSLSRDNQLGWKWWDGGYSGSSKPSPGYETLVYVQHGCGNTCLGSHIQPQMCKQKRMEMVSWGWFRTIHTISMLYVINHLVWVQHGFGIRCLGSLECHSQLTHAHISSRLVGLERVFWAISMQSVCAPHP